MSYYVKLKQRKKRQQLLQRRSVRSYHRDPSLSQIDLRLRVVALAKWYKGQRAELLYAKLTELGLTAADRRIYWRGGVGSWKWLPKLGVFRIQVRASHCSTKGAYMPYAICVEV